MAVAISKDKRGRAHLILAHDRDDGITELLCMGNKKHFRKAGGCRCTEAVLASLSEEQRARTVVVPFGDWEAYEAKNAVPAEPHSADSESDKGG